MSGPKLLAARLPTSREPLASPSSAGGPLGFRVLLWVSPIKSHWPSRLDRNASSPLPSQASFLPSLLHFRFRQNVFALHSGSFLGSLYLSTGAHWDLFWELHEAQCLAQGCFQNFQQVTQVPTQATESGTPSLAKVSLTPLRRGSFLCSLAHATPPTRHLKPDLIPLHAGNLLVYWAFLGGKLHCLYSWVQATERLTAFLRLLSQGPSLTPPLRTAK